MERLNKYLAKNGIGSRRKCDEFIIQGRVRVNNKLITELGTKVEPFKDIVKFDHREVLSSRDRFIYIMLNKPRGYLCTKSDPFGRLTIYHLLKGIKEKVNYVGRLDCDSEGLLLLTNDGHLHFNLTHPKKNIDKKYIVQVKGNFDSQFAASMEKGIPILPNNRLTGFCKVKIINEGKKTTQLGITIREGKKRQIRRMLSYLGFTVLKLKRIQIGNLFLGDLKKGKYRFLNKKEVDQLKKHSMKNERMQENIER